MKFKMGDEVEIVGNRNSHCFAVGHVGTITYVGESIYKVDSRESNNVQFEDMVLVSKKPVVAMDSVIMSEEKREQIRSAISQMENTSLIFDEWGFSEVFEKGIAVSLIFWGVPGTGKTMMAQAIADELKMKLKIVNTGDIRSSEPGGAERTIKKLFKDANVAYDKKKPVVLLFDECDSLLIDRAQIGAIVGAEVNALLTELEHYKGIVIFTTNRLGKLDPALERRIAAKIEFESPNQEQREAIWKRMIPKKAPLAANVHIKDLATIPMNGGNIKNVVLNAARKAAYLKLKEISKECFTDAIQDELVGIHQFQAAYEESTKFPVEMRTDFHPSGGGDLEVTEAKDTKITKKRKVNHD